MEFLTKLTSHQPEINLCAKKFYACMEANDMGGLYKLLSPNLQQFMSAEKYQVKFKDVFQFGQDIAGYRVHEELEITYGVVDAVIWIGINPTGADKAKITTKEGEVDEDKVTYKIFQFRFIQIGETWYVDDVYPTTYYQATKLN